MSDLDDTQPSTERPTAQKRGTERRKRSSLRVIVQENRMLFGALSESIQKLAESNEQLKQLFEANTETLELLARNTMLLRKHAHSTNDNLTVLSLKLDLLLKSSGIELPADLPSSGPAVEIGIDEEIGNGATD